MIIIRPLFRVWFALALVTIALCAVSTHTAHAQSFTSPVEMHGYAWSGGADDGVDIPADPDGNFDGGIGWISFNCDNPQQEFDAAGNLIADYPSGTCASSNYNVQINPDFTLTGYGWSSNIGWVRFGGLGTPPSADTDGVSTAQIDPDNNRLEGWARACAVFASGCSGALDPDRGDWDGWISLHGVNHSAATYGVNVGIGSMSSYAWGSDITGWIDFSLATFDRPCNTPNSCNADNTGIIVTDQWCRPTTGLCPAGEFCDPSGGASCEAPSFGTYSLEVDKPFVRRDDTVVVTWSLDNPATAFSCRVTSNNGDDLAGGPVDGSGTSDPIDRSITTFTLNCVPAAVGAGGPEFEVGSIDVQLLPSTFET